MELEEGEETVGIKMYLQTNSFEGHFPKDCHAGVLIVKLAQVGACAVLSAKEHRDVCPFAGLIMRFKRQVIPGDTIRLEVELTKLKVRFGKGKAKALVDGEVAAEGELIFALLIKTNTVECLANVCYLKVTNIASLLEFSLSTIIRILCLVIFCKAALNVWRVLCMELYIIELYNPRNILVSDFV